MAQKTPVPKYRKQKTKTGDRAFVELGGSRVYLGRHGSPESREKYYRTVSEWEAAGSRLPKQCEDVTVNELLAAFWKHAKAYYTSPSSEVANFRIAARPLCKLYGRTPVRAFGPLALKAVRQQFIDRGGSRSYVNTLTQRVRRIFRFGVADELVPPSVLHGLEAVQPVRYGRMDIRENERVKPVADEVVDTTLPHLTAVVRGMVQFQRLTGCRPGEVCILRTCDVNTTARVWTYRPERHKTQHRGRDRCIYIGPRAQEALRGFLQRDLEAYVFSPRESERERLAKQHAARKTPLSCGNMPGTNRVVKPRKAPRERFDTQSYCKSVHVGCDRAFPAPDGMDGEALRQWRKSHRWNVGQLRHSFATNIRSEFGLESAQVLLGHAAANVTQIYAERDTQHALAVALKVG